MARLVPMENTRAQRVPGRGRGEWRVSADFDAALEPDVLADFEGR